MMDRWTQLNSTNLDLTDFVSIIVAVVVWLPACGHAVHGIYFCNPMILEGTAFPV